VLLVLVFFVPYTSSEFRLQSNARIAPYSFYVTHLR
jgi:hypothetical protein